jgi:hypothetical protein
MDPVQLVALEGQRTSTPLVRASIACELTPEQRCVHMHLRSRKMLTRQDSAFLTRLCVLRDLHQVLCFKGQAGRSSGAPHHLMRLWRVNSLLHLLPAPLHPL